MVKLRLLIRNNGPRTIEFLEAITKEETWVVPAIGTNFYFPPFKESVGVIDVHHIPQNGVVEVEFEAMSYDDLRALLSTNTGWTTIFADEPL